MKIRLSEIFASVQGEGRFTGMPTIFVRFFGCNLKCDGFGQKCPTDPSTYILPYKDLDISKYKSMSELPVFEYGCDSSYSWSPRFKSLAKDYSASEVVDEIIRIGKEDLGLRLVAGDNHLDNWLHLQTRMPAQICFTGGEPMMQQKAIELILDELEQRSLNPIQVTIETNATKELKDRFGANLYTKHVHMSCSPKLYTVSGEANAIDFGVLASYIAYADSGAIKFVHNGSQEAWDEIDSKMDTIRDLIRGEPWQIWIMPAHATLESAGSDYIGPLCNEALKRGFWISLRMHVYAFGNVVGK